MGKSDIDYKNILPSNQHIIENLITILHCLIFITRQRSYGKLILSVISVCLLMAVKCPQFKPTLSDMIKCVHYVARVCSQAGSWHLTELPVCFNCGSSDTSFRSTLGSTRLSTVT